VKVSATINTDVSEHSSTVEDICGGMNIGSRRVEIGTEEEKDEENEGYIEEK